jgi:transcription antitermination protein NusB
MALSQQKFREIVFQLLYSQEIGHASSDLMIELMMNELSVSKRNVRLAFERVQQIQQQLPAIDALISSVSISYDFDRIQTVTKNILRVGVFELYFDPQIPPKVAIAEAIRLSRKFSTPESASFANALLDQLYRKKLGEQIDPAQVETLSNSLLESEQLASEIAQEHPLNSEQEDEADEDTSSSPLI